ncbi:uncharacterized protein LOC112463138 [Temnothorax curvispinosus]|uniref:Uncharacterized protein LOC112459915 n=1 Tax=Temnothorax curvispinosus TaxID=300111 RepID=A0A6J1QHD6_9HYME|nr:uncharacterized protein LOC112459915 [Temnothorax curvispinosus]XP_024885103.1 uncharacterized protein LOC112463138 [Temnothorax curvispinosus]
MWWFRNALRYSLSTRETCLTYFQFICQISIALYYDAVYEYSEQKPQRSKVNNTVYHREDSKRSKYMQRSRGRLAYIFRFRILPHLLLYRTLDELRVFPIDDDGECLPRICARR